ncbi:UNVERIFIED_CONTAM: hypothetical protein H355_011182 [Colinus virginianus]|nr:hypothetical protein H355_011182 [Colinus virginianus]
MEKSRKKFIEVIDKAIVTGNKTHRDELLFSYKGVLYPVALCSLEVFKAMESFEARSDDVILAGYPKSGTNWVGQILSDLVATFEAKSLGEGKSFNDEELEEFPYLEIGDTEKYERMKRIPSRRVILTHLAPGNLPKSIFKNKAKILLLIRNPKDVATSFFHFSNALSALPSYETWDEFFVAFMTEKSTNQALGVKNIASFLGISLTGEELQGVVERSSFQAMKKNSQKTHGALGSMLFRKGGVSDWKNLFNEEQNEKMDKVFEERIAGTKLGTKLKYEVYCKA